MFVKILNKMWVVNSKIKYNRSVNFLHLLVLSYQYQFITIIGINMRKYRFSTGTVSLLPALIQYPY